MMRKKQLINSTTTTICLLLFLVGCNLETSNRAFDTTTSSTNQANDNASESQPEPEPIPANTSNQSYFLDVSVAAESNGSTRYLGSISLEAENFEILGSAKQELILENTTIASAKFELGTSADTVPPVLNVAVETVLYERTALDGHSDYQLRSRTRESAEFSINQSSLATAAETEFFTGDGAIVIEPELDIEVIPGDLAFESTERPVLSTFSAPILNADIHEEKLFLLVGGTRECHINAPTLTVYERAFDLPRRFIPAVVRVSLDMQTATDSCATEGYTPYFFDMRAILSQLEDRYLRHIPALTISGLSTWSDIPHQRFAEPRAYVSGPSDCIRNVNCRQISLLLPNGRFAAAQPITATLVAGDYSLSDGRQFVLPDNPALTSALSDEDNTLTLLNLGSFVLRRVDFEEFRSFYPDFATAELTVANYTVFSEPRIYFGTYETEHCSKEDPEDCTVANNEVTLIFSPEGSLRVQIPHIGVEANEEAYRLDIENSVVKTGFFGLDTLTLDESNGILSNEQSQSPVTFTLERQE